MMLATKDDKDYIDVLCIKDNEFIDHVWGNCSVTEGTWYKAIQDKHVDSYLLIKFGNGLCPYKKSNFKSILELRDDKLNDLKI